MNVHSRITYMAPGPSPAGGSGAPPFHGWPPDCCIHPAQYFKNVAPLSGFRPPPAAKSWRRACMAHNRCFCLTMLSYLLPLCKCTLSFHIRLPNLGQYDSFWLIFRPDIPNISQLTYLTYRLEECR